MNETKFVDRAGIYICLVEEPFGLGWFGESGKNETPYLRLPLRVVQQIDGKVDQVGRMLNHYGWLSEKAFDSTIKAFSLTFPQWGGDLGALTSGRFTFAGLKCEVVTQADTYEGKQRVKVQWLNPVGGGGSKPMEVAKVASLIEKLQRKSLAIAKAAQHEAGLAAAPTPAGTAAQVNLDELDDIPF